MLALYLVDDDKDEHHQENSNGQNLCKHTHTSQKKIAWPPGGAVRQYNRIVGVCYGFTVVVKIQRKPSSVNPFYNLIGNGYFWSWEKRILLVCNLTMER